MKLFRCILAVLASTLLLHSLPAAAQATRTWVSGVGDDANPCSRTAPCKTFAGAISKTAASGYINCLDPGGFGAVTITKSITIDCMWNGPSGVLTTGGTSAIIINAGLGDRVTLRGLSIEGVGTGLYGVNILQAGAVQVDACRISGFRATNGAGIRVATAATSELHVKDSHILDNGSGGSGGGIVLLPTGAVDLRGSLSRVEMRDNSFGLFVSGASGSSGYVRLAASNIVAAGNQVDGVRVTGGGAAATVILDQAQLMGNTSYGVLATGPGSYAIVGRSTIVDNGGGFGSTAGGSIISYVSNQVTANGTDGVANGSAVEK